ncbi:MAG: hypothetical protein A3J80_08575 [Desulfobacula sp. RIFOXYB2_FULL_45_6]|nr:MAG: hypothetical protein A3J80_08575 [Desulfobacula sp. RIFOXYB2_FULL_45_6]
MNKLITLIITVLFLICFSTVTARADRKTMEGFMLGTGAVIIGAAIINGMNDNHRPPHYARHHSPPPPQVYIEYRGGHDNRHHRRYRDYRPRGDWEIVRVWVEPVYERRWNPAHYNHRGEWTEGRYEEFRVSEGYYQDQRVWVGR